MTTAGEPRRTTQRSTGAARKPATSATKRRTKRSAELPAGSVKRRASSSTRSATGKRSLEPDETTTSEALEPEIPEIPEIPDTPAELDGLHTMDGAAAKPVSRNLDPSQLYRGRARLALLKDLALGEWSDAAIAQSVGVPTEIITDFRLTYENEISEVRAALAGRLAVESAGLWISKRQNRLAELQQDFEDIDIVIDQMRENTSAFNLKLAEGTDNWKDGDAFDVNMLLGSRRHQNLLRSKLAILKSAADELAPSKRDKDDDANDKNVVRYVIEQDNGQDDIIGSLT